VDVLRVRKGGSAVKVQPLTISGGVKRSAEFQSTDASFEVVITLDAGEQIQEVYGRVYQKMMRNCQQEAQEELREAIRIKREVEGV
jgi:hypothetical protein